MVLTDSRYSANSFNVLETCFCFDLQGSYDRFVCTLDVCRDVQTISEAWKGGSLTPNALRWEFGAGDNRSGFFCSVDLGYDETTGDDLAMVRCSMMR